MTTPAIRALRESVAGRKITLLTSKAGAEITQFIPEVDEVIEFDIPWEKHDANTSHKSVADIVELIRSKHFDAAIVFTTFSQNPLSIAMLCYMAGISRVAGYCRENPHFLMSEWVPDLEPLYEIKHEVNRQLYLVQNLGAELGSDNLSLKISETAKENVQSKLANLGIDKGKQWIVMHPGVNDFKKQYPIENFAEAAKRLVSELDYYVIVTGSASETELANYIVNEVGEGAFSLAGKLELEELIALLQLSPLLISNNCGPVHIAAAMQTPVVVLYALTNPQHSPWKMRHIVLPFDVPKEIRSKNSIVTYAYEKSFINPPLMVDPEEILEAVNELLEPYEDIRKTQIVHV